MEEKLSSIDLCFLNLDTSNNPQHIAIVCLLESCPDITEISGKISKLIEEYPKLKQKLNPLNKLSWVDYQEFSVENHLKVVDLPHGHSVYSEISKKFTEKLDYTKPLWEISLLCNPLDPSSLSALIIKTHHCLTDGLAIRKILFDLFNYDETKKYHNNKTSFVESKKETRRDNVILNLFHLVKELYKRPIITKLNSPNSPERKIEFIDFELDQIAIIRNRLGGSINDFFLALVTNALKQYLQAESSDSEKLLALMPVNLRTDNNFKNLGNKFSILSLELPLTSNNFSTQHKIIRERIADLKSKNIFYLYALLAKINSKLPRFFQLRVLNKTVKKSNLICTNVPGPSIEVYLSQSKLSSLYGCPALLENQGIGFALTSYAEKLCLSYVYDPKIILKPELIRKHLLETISNLN